METSFSLNIKQVVLREKEEIVLKQIFAFLFIRSQIVLIIRLYDNFLKKKIIY